MKSVLSKCLVISLSNIGDVVLTAPVIDVLLREFPQSTIDIVTGPKVTGFFAGNTRLNQFIIDKSKGLQGWIALARELRQYHYEVIVDLRQTCLPLLLKAKRKTDLIVFPYNGHRQYKHMSLLHRFKELNLSDAPRQSFTPEHVSRIQENGYVMIAPSAQDEKKRWAPSRFVELANELLRRGEKIVWIGASADIPLLENITSQLTQPTLNLAGQLNLRQLLDVIQRSKYVIVHDSGPMHMASYLNAPVVALWGLTPLKSYGPWGKQYVVVSRQADCARCQNPRLEVAHECMQHITLNDVLQGIDRLAAHI